MCSTSSSCVRAVLHSERGRRFAITSRAPVGVLLAPHRLGLALRF